MTTTDPENTGRKRLALLTQEGGERIEHGLTASEPGSLLTGLVEDPPPYHAGPRRKLPSWAKHLRPLRHLEFVE